VPGLTNSQFLPYQVGTDLRCDAADPASDDTKGMWRQFVETVEDRLAPLQLLANRLTNVPMALVEWHADDAGIGETVGVLNDLWNNTGIHWNTVVVDTDNMVDLDGDPNHVTPNRPGVYQVWGMVRFLNPFTIGASYSMSLSGGAGVSEAGNGFYLSRTWTSTYFWFNTEPGTSYKPTDVTGSRQGYWNPEESGGLIVRNGFAAAVSGSNDARVSFAQMGVVWHSELQV
jgi:hypothetical protein